jgi:hypothetical protein
MEQRVPATVSFFCPKLSRTHVNIRGLRVDVSVSRSCLEMGKRDEIEEDALA